jgi:hypothetical protein
MMGCSFVMDAAVNAIMAAASFITSIVAMALFQTAAVLTTKAILTMTGVWLACTSGMVDCLNSKKSKVMYLAQFL